MGQHKCIIRFTKCKRKRHNTLPWIVSMKQCMKIKPKREKHTQKKSNSNGFHSVWAGRRTLWVHFIAAVLKLQEWLYCVMKGCSRFTSFSVKTFDWMCFTGYPSSSIKDPMKWLNELLFLITMSNIFMMQKRNIIQTEMHSTSCIHNIYYCTVCG